MKTGQDASVRANIISLPGLLFVYIPGMHKEKVGDHVLMTCLVVTRMCKRLEGRTYRIDFFPTLLHQSVLSNIHAWLRHGDADGVAAWEAVSCEGGLPRFGSRPN